MDCPDNSLSINSAISVFASVGIGWCCASQRGGEIGLGGGAYATASDTTTFLTRGFAGALFRLPAGLPGFFFASNSTGLLSLIGFSARVWSATSELSLLGCCSVVAPSAQVSASSCGISSTVSAITARVSVVSAVISLEIQKYSEQFNAQNSFSGTKMILRLHAASISMSWPRQSVKRNEIWCISPAGTDTKSINELW